MIKRGFILSTQLLSTLTIIFAVTIYALLRADMLNQKVGFTLLTILLLCFLTAEINLVRLKQPDRWLLNPAIFCSITTFAIYFGITNIIYFFPDYAINALGISSKINLSMNKLMLIVIIGAIAMWLGYWSSISSQLLNSQLITNLQYKYFNQDSIPVFWVIPSIYLIANLSRLAEVWLGIYGYSANYQHLMDTISYNQFLITLDNAGVLALLIVSLQYYAKNPGILTKLYFYIIIVGELFWGLLSGMKSAVMIPFIIIFITQYLRQKHIVKIWIVLVPMIIFSSYSLIEPFRNEKNNNPHFEATSVSGIITAMIGAQQRQYQAKHRQEVQELNDQENLLQTEENVAITLKFLRRINLTSDAAVGINFADSNEKLPEGSPDFLLNTILAPISAFIPRFIWHDKAIQNIGIWYTQVVMGQPDSLSSTAMSIFTDLYFVGGIIAVFIGMFVIGMMQRLMFFATKPWISGAGAIVYLGLMTKFEIIAESDTQTIIGFTFRMLPILLIFQAICYQHGSKRFRPRIKSAK